jgi:hypothetical protein
MNYIEKNYNEIYDILEQNKGIIESKYIDDLFYAFQIASGQGYFNARIKAILDYFTKYSVIIIKYSERQVILRNLNDLESYFKSYDRAFKITDLK